MNSKNNRRLICCKRRPTFRWVQWFWEERNELTGVVVVVVAVARLLPVRCSLLLVLVVLVLFILRIASTPIDAIFTRFGLERRLMVVVVAGTFSSAASYGTATATIVLRSCIIIIMVTIELIYCAFVLMILEFLLFSMSDFVVIYLLLYFIACFIALALVVDY